MSPAYENPEESPMTIKLCAAERQACLGGRRWTVGTLLGVLIFISGVLFAWIASQRDNVSSNSSNIKVIEANIQNLQTGQVRIEKAIERIDDKLDEMRKIP